MSSQQPNHQPGCQLKWTKISDLLRYTLLKCSRKCLQNSDNRIPVVLVCFWSVKKSGRIHDFKGKQQGFFLFGYYLIYFAPASTDLWSYQKHCTISLVQGLSVFSVSFLYEEEPPRSTPWGAYRWPGSCIKRIDQRFSEIQAELTNLPILPNLPTFLPN